MKMNIKQEDIIPNVNISQEARNTTGSLASAELSILSQTWQGWEGTGGYQRDCPW